MGAARLPGMRAWRVGWSGSGVGAWMVAAALVSGACGKASTGDPAPSALKGGGGTTSSTGTPGFVLTGSMQTARANHTATLLGSGKVLVTGGESPGGASQTSAELYDPKAGTFTATGAMGAGRQEHTATLLPDGRVLIVGGTANGAGPRDSAELYDPVAGTFTPTGSMSVARYQHTATLLANGTVLVAGGENGATAYATAELYDPATGQFTPTGPMATARQQHSATLLPSGQVLIAGGTSNTFGVALASAELYSPRTGSFSPTGAMSLARIGHSATPLGSGKVLVTGGFAFGSHAAELYDAKAGSFSLTGATTAADGHAATAVGGQVLVTGGEGLLDAVDYAGTTPHAAVYRSGSFSAIGSMYRGRRFHTATALPNGQVLVAGGIGGLGVFASAELYQSTVKACVAGAPGCGWHDGDMLAYYQVEWSEAGATLLSTSYNAVYASTFDLLELGIPGPDGYSMRFSAAYYLTQFLPQSGAPAPLAGDYIDPTSTTAGRFGGEVAALQLDVDFADAGLLHGTTTVKLGDLTLCGAAPLPDGTTVRDFLATANTALGGGTSPYAIADLDDLAQRVTLAFTDGYVSDFAAAHLVNGACP